METKEPVKPPKKKRTAIHIGPVYMSFNSMPYLVFGWFLTAFLLMMITRAGALFDAPGAELGIWDDEPKLLYFAIIAGLLFMLRIKIKGKLGFFVSTLFYVGLPFAAYGMIEMVNGIDGYAREPQMILMNVIFIAMVYLVFLALFGNYRWSAIVATVVLYAFALAAHYMMAFRGTPFVPGDVLSVMDMIANCSFEWTEFTVVGTIWAVLIMGVGYQLGNANLVRTRWKVSIRALALLAMLVLGGAFYSQTLLQDEGYATTCWDQKSSYDKYGNWMAFCLNLPDTFSE